MNPLLTGLLPIVGDVIKKVVPDKAGQEKAMAELESKLADNEQALLLAQADITKQQAMSNDKFVSRARPALMWVCVIGLAIVFIVDPVLMMLSNATELFTYPEGGIDINDNVLMGLVTSMLGLVGTRSYDKTKGNHLK